MGEVVKNKAWDIDLASTVGTAKPPTRRISNTHTYGEHLSYFYNVYIFVALLQYTRVKTNAFYNLNRTFPHALAKIDFS